jgi:hypothetical protein
MVRASATTVIALVWLVACGGFELEPPSTLVRRVEVTSTVVVDGRSWCVLRNGNLDCFRGQFGSRYLRRTGVDAFALSADLVLWIEHDGRLFFTGCFGAFFLRRSECATPAGGIEEITPEGGLRGFRSLSVSGPHGCVVDRDGRLMCIGFNAELGLWPGLPSNDFYRLREIPFTEPVNKVAVLINATCVEIERRRVVCWGGRCQRETHTYDATRSIAGVETPAMCTWEEPQGLVYSSVGVDYSTTPDGWVSEKVGVNGAHACILGGGTAYSVDEHGDRWWWGVRMTMSDEVECTPSNPCRVEFAAESCRVEGLSDGAWCYSCEGTDGIVCGPRTAETERRLRIVRRSP